MTDADKKELIHSRINVLLNLAILKKDTYDGRWMQEHRWGTSWEKPLNDIEMIQFFLDKWIDDHFTTGTNVSSIFFDDMNDFYEYLRRL